MIRKLVLCLILLALASGCGRSNVSKIVGKWRAIGMQNNAFGTNRPLEVQFFADGKMTGDGMGGMMSDYRVQGNRLVS